MKDQFEKKKRIWLFEGEKKRERWQKMTWLVTESLPKKTKFLIEWKTFDP